jgi:hypothetical protein
MHALIVLFCDVVEVLHMVLILNCRTYFKCLWVTRLGSTPPGTNPGGTAESSLFFRANSFLLMTFSEILTPPLEGILLNKS